MRERRPGAWAKVGGGRSVPWCCCYGATPQGAQRKQRRIKDLRSELLDIPGVGAKTAQKLLTELGSAKAVKAASEAEIAAVTGPAVARSVRQFYDAGDSAVAGNGTETDSQT